MKSRYAISRRSMAAAMVAGAMALAASLGPAQAEPKYVAKLGTTAPAGSSLMIPLERLATLISQRTNGEVELQLFAGSQLGGEVEVIEGMRLGSIEAGLLTSGLFVQWVPEDEVLDLPFIFRNDEQAQAVCGVLQTEMAAKFLVNGFRVLSCWNIGARNLISAFPIATPEDIQGRKMRVMQIPLHLATWKAAGANPTPVPAPEVYSALQTGLVDMVDNVKTVYRDFKWSEVAKYYTELGPIYSIMTITFSDKWLSKLPQEHQDAIARSARDYAEFAYQLNSYNQDIAIADTVKAGSTYTRVTDKEPWVKLMAPIWDDVKGKLPDGARLIAVVQAIQ